MKPEMKGALRLPRFESMDIILDGLRPYEWWHEKKKLDERDEVWKGKVMPITRRRKCFKFHRQISEWLECPDCRKRL